MTFPFDSVEAIRAQLDPVLAAIGWRASFANHSYPFLVPSVDWYAGEPSYAFAATIARPWDLGRSGTVIVFLRNRSTALQTPFSFVRRIV
jgi:hypothetical protein